jgi:hypothetical protein
MNWQRWAKCANDGINPENFFIADTNYDMKVRLRRVCNICVVRQFCLEENLTVPFGMYGGLIYRERVELAHARGYHITKYTGFFDLKLPRYDIGLRLRGKQGKT